MPAGPGLAGTRIRAYLDHQTIQRKSGGQRLPVTGAGAVGREVTNRVLYCTCHRASFRLSLSLLSGQAHLQTRVGCAARSLT